jgi:hypothetical protein
MSPWSESIVLLHFLQALLPVSHPVLLIVIFNNFQKMLSHFCVDHQVTELLLWLNPIPLIDNLDLFIDLKVYVYRLSLIGLQLMRV